MWLSNGKVSGPSKLKPKDIKAWYHTSHPENPEHESVEPELEVWLCCGRNFLKLYVLCFKKERSPIHLELGALLS